MEYIILTTSAFLLFLGFTFKKKQRRLLSTGRVPDVIAAEQKATLFLILAAFTMVAFIWVKTT